MYNYDKMNTWLKIFTGFLIFTIIMFILMFKQEEASKGAYIFGSLALIGITVTILSVIKYNIYNAKSQNMTAEEYLDNRFKNAIPETKQLLSIKDNDNSKPIVTCPYCNSTNTEKISDISKAIAVSLLGIHAISKAVKQWHCNNCNSDF